MRGYLFVALSLTGCAIDDVESIEQHVQAQRVLLPVSGTGQHAVVVTGLYHPLDVALYELDGTPVGGATITFTAPMTGASSTFESGGVTETDGEGRASLRPYTNERAGAYTVWAHADGASPMPFLLTNHADVPARVVVASGSNQAAPFGKPFATPLAVDVADAYGNPVQGVSVAFIPPVHGPTARMLDRTVTDAEGRATAFAVAGDQPGPFTVDAMAEGVGEYRFTLTNVDPTDVRWRYRVAPDATMQTLVTP